MNYPDSISSESRADRLLAQAEGASELADLLSDREPQRAAKYEREAAWCRYQATERYYAGEMD